MAPIRSALIVFAAAFMLGSVSANRTLQLQDQSTNPKRSKDVMKGRQLTQSDLSTCGGAQQIGSAADNLCCPMCWCVGNQSPNKMFAGTALQQLCNTKCAQCVAEASQCVSPSDPLPGTCKEGLQFNEMVKELVDKCFNMYTTDPSSVSTAVGC